jgi:hypothetical protein
LANAIITENQNVGSTGWLMNGSAPTQMAVWCDKTSYNPGDTVKFYASQQTAGAYTIKIYRLGWYNGLGGALKATIPNASGMAQGWYDSTGPTLHNCPTAIYDSSTHNWESGWAQTDSWAIPGGAVTGVYVAAFTDGSNNQGGVHFVVKGNNPADYLYVTPTMTDQAYNAWGLGHSLYSSITVDVKDSYNRPNDTGYGCGTFFKYQYGGIRWLEMQGYNLSYLSDIDVHSNSAQLTNFKALIFGAHDEYWTLARRNGVEAAIAAGVGIVNLGANSCYWQCRLEVDSASVANRTLVCYKVQTGASNLALDPQFGVNNTIVTSLWRDAVLNRPENRMWGIMWGSDQNWPGFNVGWKVDASPDTTYFAGTGLVAGTTYGTDIVGYEWDLIQSGSPAGLKTIGTSPITDKNSVASTSNTTFYRAPSGALVFSSGSIGWVNALDGYRYNSANLPVVPGIQVLMTNIMGAMKGPVFGNIRR